MIQTIKPADKKSPDSQGTSYARWVGFGMEFCGALAVCCFLGYKLDQWLNSGILFLLAGFFVGFAGMLYIVIKETFPEKFRRK
ncbi:MAG: AtpZ/AtpI family protein [Sedimentisphaerales bacterium]